MQEWHTVSSLFSLHLLILLFLLFSSLFLNSCLSLNLCLENETCILKIINKNPGTKHFLLYHPPSLEKKKNKLSQELFCHSSSFTYAVMLAWESTSVSISKILSGAARTWAVRLLLIMLQVLHTGDVCAVIASLSLCLSLTVLCL